MTDIPAGPRRRPKVTTREHIENLVDPGSFTSVAGGDGGYARIDGRPVVAGFSHTLFEWALGRNVPYICLASGTGGLARGGPRDLGSLDPVFGMQAGPVGPLDRLRRVPVISAIVHHSFGDSTFFTGLSDFVIQLRGTCLALTGPRVLAVGTKEEVSMEDLGGVDVHRRNGQVDAVAEDFDQVYQLIRRALSYLPTYRGGALPVAAVDREGTPSAHRPDALGGGYVGKSGRQILERICDHASLFEVKRDFAPSLITAFGRVDGCPVGVIASNPATDEGAFTADACLKATRHICLVDSFGLPLIFLIDGQGGPADEPRRGGSTTLSRAMMLAKAVQMSRVPKCFVVTGRAFGVGLLITGSARIGRDLVVAWPDCRVGFDGLDAPNTESVVICDDWVPDGVIEPDQTRDVLRSHLAAVAESAPEATESALAKWPVGF
jgi:methylmalonyl-CoA decarboxylase subunit alpha